VIGGTSIVVAAVSVRVSFSTIDVSKIKYQLATIKMKKKFCFFKSCLT
jgi:hypothetical protein